MNRVLIVEDARLIRESLAKSIGQLHAGSIVSGAAGNGEEALEWLEGHYADICLTDIRMPRLDGLKLLERINERYPWMATIIVSSYDEFEYARKSLQLQAVDYILKPVEPEQLVRSLDLAAEALARRRHREASETLLRMSPHCRPLARQWVELLKTQHSGGLPALADRTLDMLKTWAGGTSPYLLPALAKLWMNTVLEELANEGIRLPWGDEEPSADGLDAGDAALPIDQALVHFRRRAASSLERDGIRLAETIRSRLEADGVSSVMRQMKDYIHRHYAEKIGLQDIADAVGISRNYVSAVFKNEAGATVLQYIVDLRLKKAAELLAEGGHRIYEVAQRVGYDDIDYFAKLFRTAYGMTPAEYKKKMSLAIETGREGGAST
jgi:two-component system response regulator YesN